LPGRFAYLWGFIQWVSACTMGAFFFALGSSPSFYHGRMPPSIFSLGTVGSGQWVYFCVIDLISFDLRLDRVGILEPAFYLAQVSDSKTPHSPLLDLGRHLALPTPGIRSVEAATWPCVDFVPFLEVLRWAVSCNRVLSVVSLSAA
jgi:hypothetical protein